MDGERGRLHTCKRLRSIQASRYRADPHPANAQLSASAALARPSPLKSVAASLFVKADSRPVLGEARRCERASLPAVPRWAATSTTTTASRCQTPTGGSSRPPIRKPPAGSQHRTRSPRTFLAAVSARESVRTQVTAMWNYPKLTAPFERGGRWFQFRNPGLDAQPVLYLLDDPVARPARCWIPTRCQRTAPRR